MDHSPNTDHMIVENIAKRNKVVLINTANRLVKEEYRKICKRESGSIPQKKEHHDFLRFSWENYYHELQSSCPLILSTVSAIVCDIPPAIPSKHFMHIMMTAAIGLHKQKPGVIGCTVPNWNGFNPWRLYPKGSSHTAFLYTF